MATTLQSGDVVVVVVLAAVAHVQPVPDQGWDEGEDQSDDGLNNPVLVGHVVATVGTPIVSGAREVDPAVGPVQKHRHT